jgi:hypothetical protein
MNPPNFVFSYFRAFVINFNQAVAHDDALEEITKGGKREKLQARVTLKAPREAYGSLLRISHINRGGEGKAPSKMSRCAV